MILSTKSYIKAQLYFLVSFDPLVRRVQNNYVWTGAKSINIKINEWFWIGYNKNAQKEADGNSKIMPTNISINKLI